MECRIPRTATRRGAMAYAKLIERVDPQAKDGFGFHGRFLQPGARIDDSELPAGKGRNAIVLECTDAEGPHDAAHNRKTWEKLYILWRWNTVAKAWAELARCQCRGAEWAAILREPTRIALGRESWAVVPAVAEVSGRIRALLDHELAGLEPGQESQVLAELHDQLAARIVRAGGGVVPQLAMPFQFRGQGMGIDERLAALAQGIRRADRQHGARRERPAKLG